MVCKLYCLFLPQIKKTVVLFFLCLFLSVPSFTHFEKKNINFVVELHKLATLLQFSLKYVCNSNLLFCCPQPKQNFRILASHSTNCKSQKSQLGFLFSMCQQLLAIELFDRQNVYIKFSLSFSFCFSIAQSPQLGCTLITSHVVSTKQYNQVGLNVKSSPRFKCFFLQTGKSII